MINSAKLYVKAGVDLEKINLGLAWYGRTYKLLDRSCAGYGCEMTGAGEKGVCTGEGRVSSLAAFPNFIGIHFSWCLGRFRNCRPLAGG